MSANSAKFLISIDGIPSSHITVTNFKGDDAISAPYCFDINFQLSESILSSKQPLPVITAKTVLGKSCRFELVRDDGGIGAAYNGVIREFSAEPQRAVPVFSIRLVPWMQLLSHNVNNRVFQRLNVVQIIEKVIRDSGLGSRCVFEYKCKENYPQIGFCVQHQETDLNFISRLMEQSGIWYFFEDFDMEKKKDRVVITDNFSRFPREPAAVSFDETAGFSEMARRADGNGFTDVETVYFLSSRSAMTPKSVRLRTQNYRTPENCPEGTAEAGEKDGTAVWGSVYEYGGNYKNASEAKRGADLYLKRLIVENTRTDGASVCRTFKAGRIVEIGPGIGEFLLVSVTHIRSSGNEDNGYIYTYKNAFSAIDSAPSAAYAPPLRAVTPRANGIITARVEALGKDHPSLNECGCYRVKLAPDEAKTEPYGSSKDIRLAQPFGGAADGECYGFHFPSKTDAEMVLAYVDGNPDKPIGLGFVPDADAPSVVNSQNRDENIIRTWGGNELVMDDTSGKEKIVLATTVRQKKKSILDLLAKEGTKENCELTLGNDKMKAVLKAWMNEISLNCSTSGSSVSVSTCGKNEIKVDDIKRSITMKTLMGCALKIDEMKDVISLTNADPSTLGLRAAGYGFDKLAEKYCPAAKSKAVKEITKELSGKTKLNDNVKEWFPRNSFKMDGKKKNISIETAEGCKIAMYDKVNTDIKLGLEKGKPKLEAEEKGGNGKIVITTGDGCKAVLDNENNIITLQNIKGANTVTMDGKNGKISITTRDGCSIVLDNSKDRITLRNANGANQVVLDGEKKKLFLDSKGDINIKADKAINISGKNLNLLSKNKMAVKSSQGVVEVKGRTIKLN